MSSMQFIQGKGMTRSSVLVGQVGLSVVLFIYYYYKINYILYYLMIQLTAGRLLTIYFVPLLSYGIEKSKLVQPLRHRYRRLGPGRPLGLIATTDWLHWYGYNVA